MEKTGRHAFLIIAHNEFEILNELVHALDHPDVDLYVHIDKRSKHKLKTNLKQSSLHIPKKRISVIWGSYRQIKCEMLLMHEAWTSGNNYDFYHIISGLHYPLKDMRDILDFYKKEPNTSVIQLLRTDIEEIKMKLGLRHAFLKYLVRANMKVRMVDRFFWNAFNSMQKRLNIRRDVSLFKTKALNWCSITPEVVQTVLNNKLTIEHHFKHTFCGDEYFIPFILEQFTLPFRVTDKLLFQIFPGATPAVLKNEDYTNMVKSGCLFGRKFTERESMAMIKKLKDEKTGKDSHSI